MEKATAIICVYNEQDTVNNVIIATSLEEHINEIIVVNDGSSDNSKTIIDSLKSRYDLTVIHFDKNMGKGHAMAVGVENASHSNPPIFNGARLWNYAAIFSFIAGVIPPIPMLGRSLL